MVIGGISLTIAYKQFRRAERAERRADEAASPRVEVRVSPFERSAFFALGSGPTHAVTSDELHVTATNTGLVPVSIMQFVLVTNIDREYVIRDVHEATLPAPLQPADALTASDSVHDVLKDLRAEGDFVVWAEVRGAGGLRWRTEDLGPFLHIGASPDG